MTTVEAEREIQAELSLADQLADYSGKWVAVKDHQVVLSADSIEELLERIESEETQVETAFQVPEGDDAACFF
jgi:hypothetical protein